MLAVLWEDKPDTASLHSHLRNLIFDLSHTLDVYKRQGALRFFADPEMSGYITGQVIAVDGGFLSCPGI